MKMRYHDRFDFVAINLQCSETGVGRRATVEQHRSAFPAHQDGGLPATAGSKGVARSDEKHFIHAPSSPG